MTNGEKQRIVPSIDLKMFFIFNPYSEKLSFLKIITITIPNPATPNYTPAFNNNLDITLILLFVRKPFI